MQQNKKQKSLIYVGLLVLIAWFTSQGCFPIVYPQVPDPCVSASPAQTGTPTNSPANAPCPSPTPKI